MRALQAAAAIVLAGTAIVASADLYSVVNTDDGGAGSLRQAILDVNAHPGADGILFEIPGGGVHTLTPASELPALTGPTVITGLSQEGAACGVWPPTLRIVIDGFQAGAGATGITLFGDDSVVTGLVIRNFDGPGIEIQNNHDTVVRCNFIGTSADGSFALGNGGDGIVVFSSVDSTIGGTQVSHRNLISGNGSAGVDLGGISTGSEVIGNYIGTDVTGMAALPNAIGVRSTGPDVTIGGVAPDGGNLISGNTTGILIFNDGASGNLVFGNRIGLDAAGEPTLGNGTGIAVNAGATNTLIGATSLANLGNEIAGNTYSGVLLFNDETTLGNAIRGNSIYQNGELGIALDGTGPDPTPNDPGDADEGPNRLQNFPEIASATQDGEAPVDVAYFVPSDPANASYPITVDVYVADADGQEGRTWIGSDVFQEADYAAGDPKHFGIAVFFTGGTPELVATATDADGNTSEFGPAVAVPEAGAAPVAAAAALGALAWRRARRRPAWAPSAGPRALHGLLREP